MSDTLKIRMSSNNGAFNASLGFNRKEILRTIIWGVGGGVTISLIQFPYELFYSTDIPNYFLYYLLKIRSRLFLSLLISIVIAPLLEELIFRGWVFRYLFTKFNRAIAYVGSTLLFMLAHWSTKGILLICISSLILTYIFEKTRSLGTSIIAHALWNASWYTAIIFIFNDRGLL